jgi:hypothetical protein
MTDDREHSTLTIACLVPTALIAMVVALSALKRCVYASPQVAEHHQQNEPGPTTRPLPAHDAHTRDPEDPDEVRGIRQCLKNGQRLVRRDDRKPPEELTKDREPSRSPASVVTPYQSDNSKR